MIFCDKIFPTKNAKETLEIFNWEAVTSWGVQCLKHVRVYVSAQEGWGFVALK